MDLYSEILLVYPEFYNRDEVRLISTKLSELSEEDSQSLLSFIFDRIKDIKNFLNEKGFYEIDQIKKQKGIFISNKDEFYYQGRYNNLRSFKKNKKFSEFELEEIVDKKIFVEIKVPNEVEIQIESFKKRREDKKKKLEEKRKQKQIFKAKKLLENLEK